MGGSGTTLSQREGPRGFGHLKPSGSNLLFVVILFIAFIEGAAVMLIELTAARILTPYFGQSVFVWTNIIGIILAAVAVGNYVGGRLADRSKTLLPLFVFFFLSGAFCLAVPFLIGKTAAFFLGEGLHLEEVFPLLVRGSFSTALLLFAPPVLLACVCLPFLVKAAAEECGKVGRASGSVYGSSTLGSIAGTFLSSYILIELIGSRRTFSFLGAFMILVSVLGFIWIGKKKTKAFGYLLMTVLSLFFAAGGIPSQSTRPGDEVLFECESRYQYIRVVESSHDPKEVNLTINEGLDSFHSLYTEGKFLTDEQYYDYYCLLPALADLKHPELVCIVGLAGGTNARQYTHFFGETPGFRIDGVELDARTVEAGYRFMDLGYTDGVLSEYCDRDGRMFLTATDTLYDVIILDAYSKQVYIPFHMTTQEFFQIVFEKLEDGGIMGMNVSGFNYSDELLSAITNTAASVFGSVSVSRIPEGRNFMVYGVRGLGHIDPRTVSIPESAKELSPLLDNISAFGVTRKVEYDPASTLLTDDHAPVESLCDCDLIKHSLLLMEQVE